MSFNDLSAELFALIVSHLKRDPGPVRLAPYSTISAAFSDAVEAETFSRLCLDSDMLQYLDDALQRRPQRGGYLGALEFEVILPSYPEQAYRWYERKADRDKNNESFTQSIKRLFDILSKWDGLIRARPVSLSLSRAYSPTDTEFLERLGWEPYRRPSGNPVQKVPMYDLFDPRYEHSYVRLLAAQHLPTLHRVKSLTMRMCRDSRYLAPAVGPMLGKSLPNLSSVLFVLCDHERKYPRRRKQLRQEFCEAFQSWDLARVTDLNLTLCHPPPCNEDFENADVRDKGGIDPLSVKLGRLMHSPNLVHVQLSGPMCVGPDIFRFLSGSAKQWPSLQTSSIHISSVRPDGGWYFIPHPNPPPAEDERVVEEEGEEGPLPDHLQDYYPSSSSSDSDFDPNDSASEEAESQRPADTFDPELHDLQTGEKPYNHFRLYPSPEVEALYEDAFRALMAMPKIKKFQVDMDVGSRNAPVSPQGFGFTFTRKGTKQFDGDDDYMDQNRVWWEPLDGWVLSEKWKKMWEGILGKGGVVKWFSG